MRRMTFVWALAALAALMLPAVGVAGESMVDMNGLMIRSAIVQLIYAAVALVLVFLLIWLRDLIWRLDYMQTMESIRDDPKAAAVYFGLWAMAAAILLGLILS